MPAPVRFPFSTTVQRFLVPGALAVAVAASSLPACAATAVHYSQAAFNRALAASVPLVVHVCAGWSPLCRVQKPIVATLLRGPRMLPVLLLNVDFDTDRYARRVLHAPYQGTLIVFKDGREVARSSGDTDRTAIAALLNKAL